VLVAQATLDAGASAVSFHPEMAELPAEIVPTLRPGDICVCMGAGSIEFLSEDLLSALEAWQEKGDQGS
jgi:UDP-N-acetylmuramate-alanine ligase